MSTIYVSKYALTRGIFVADAFVHPDGTALYTTDRGEGRYFHKGEYSQSFELARQQAEKRKFAAIKTTQRKLEKLCALVFFEPLLGQEQ